MSQEYGYQRSSKKCREKFENLYKYYKKTKEGRQDGKHYRFFRQLDALYGTTNNNNSSPPHFHYNFPDQEPYPLSKISDSSLPESCYCDATSSQCTDSNAEDARMKKKKKNKKMKASIEAQMRSMMEKQEAWMEKMTRAIEEKEQERLLREEQWRRQDAARIDGEHEMWAKEKAWIEARDAALMEAFNKVAAREIESEVMRPIRLKSEMEVRFQENGISEEMAGDSRGLMCREKWDHVINDYLIECSKKKKKEGDAYDQNRDSISDAMRLHEHGNGWYF